MQSNRMKVFVDDNGYIYILFYKDNGIFIKGKDKYGEEVISKISENVLPQFSVFADKGAPAVAVKKPDGNIYICRYKNKKWEEHIFLKSDPLSNTKFYIHSHNGRIDVLYNCPTEVRGEEVINVVSLVNRKWQMPVNIERVVPFSLSPYMVINITSDHLVLLCNKKGEGIVMKEILLSPVKTGKSVALFSSADALEDISCLINGDTVHMAFVLKTRRGSRIIYKNKNSMGLSENKILWENGRINSCNMVFAKGRLWIVALVGTYVFCSYSEDNGASFCPFYMHSTKLTGAVVKVEITGKTVSNEAYVYQSTNEMVIFDEINDGLFVKENIGIKEASNDGIDSEEKLRILKNKNDIYEKQLNEANKKIGELSRKLAQRNEELSVINSRWIRRINSLNMPIEKKQLPTVIYESLPQEE